MSVQSEFQAAIYAVLDAGLTDPIYDHVLDNVQSKYVVLGQDTYIDWDTDDTIGFEATITIHSWDNRSETRGMKPIQDLQFEIYELLHRQTLSTTNYQVVTMQQEYSETIMEADGVTRHGIQRFRVILTEV